MHHVQVSSELPDRISETALTRKQAAFGRGGFSLVSNVLVRSFQRLTFRVHVGWKFEVSAMMTVASRRSHCRNFLSLISALVLALHSGMASQTTRAINPG